MASSGVVLGDLVNTVPLMLHGLPITGTRTCFSLPRADTPVSDLALIDTTYVSLLTLFRVFPFFNLIFLLSNFSNL